MQDIRNFLTTNLKRLVISFMHVHLQRILSEMKNFNFQKSFTMNMVPHVGELPLEADNQH